MRYGDLVTHKTYVHYRWVSFDVNNSGPEFVRYKLSTPYKYRAEPVPGIHKFGHGFCYKKMKTTQERRLCSTAIEQGVTVRGKRTCSMLPAVWDDKLRSDINNRSWKQSKKRKQWM